MAHHLAVRVLPGALALALLAGCTGGGVPLTPTTTPGVATPGTTTATEPTTPSTPERPEGTVELTGEMVINLDGEGAPFTVHVHPVQSSAADGAALLTIDLERGTGGGTAIMSGIGLNFVSGPAGGAPTGFTLVDLAASQAATPVNVGAQPAITEVPDGLAPGQTGRITGVYPAVAGATVSVVVPGFGIVEVPVVQGDSAAWPQEAKDWVAGQREGAFVPIESWAKSLVTQSTVEVAGDAVMVSLPSDVLFAVDKHELSAKAQKVVDKAGAKIAEAAAATGEITVVGHTDDQADEAYNQKLSERRAEAVAKRLRPILGSTFTIKTEGRGESDPAVEGTSDEARAANRRVEIEFTGKSANKLVVVDDVPTELPETAGVVVQGTETAQVPPTGLNPALQTRIVSLQRVGNHLVGVLEVAAPETKAAAVEFFGDFTFASNVRGVSNIGPSGVALLTPTSRVFPSDFASTGQDAEKRFLVGDRDGGLLPGPGGPHRYVVVWPDTDPTATSVTIDAPDLYRFVDVPIS